MSSTNVNLKSMHCSGNTKLLEFIVEQNNGKTTVDQVLKIKSLNGKWVAQIEFEDFPTQDTAKKAAHKLGDWLVRLGEAINEEDTEFETIKL